MSKGEGIHVDLLANLDLDTLQLAAGGHEGLLDGACVMEGPLRSTIARRLADRLIPAGECLVYRGATSYGVMKVAGRSYKAHRLAWEFTWGPIPNGFVVCHHCDNPPCCYVDHLFLGTVADNNRDRARKGRSRGVFVGGETHPARQRRGENHWRARLSDADVRAIRTRRNSGESLDSIAMSYGVNSATISRIARRVWRQEVA